MIVFDLECAAAHRFEAWFGSSDDFADQQARGLVACPLCESKSVRKAPMAPAIPRKGDRPSAPVAAAPTMPTPQLSPAVADDPRAAKLRAAIGQLARMQAAALENSRWVGNRFAEETRAQHYGERPEETIHGQATPDQAIALAEEGIAVTPLPFPIAPPDETH